MEDEYVGTWQNAEVTLFIAKNGWFKYISTKGLMSHINGYFRRQDADGTFHLYVLLNLFVFRVFLTVFCLCCSCESCECCGGCCGFPPVFTSTKPTDVDGAMTMTFNGQKLRRIKTDIQGWMSFSPGVNLV